MTFDTQSVRHIITLGRFRDRTTVSLKHYYHLKLNFKCFGEKLNKKCQKFLEARSEAM